MKIYLEILISILALGCSVSANALDGDACLRYIGSHSGAKELMSQAERLNTLNTKIIQIVSERGSNKVNTETLFTGMSSAGARTGLIGFSSLLFVRSVKANSTQDELNETRQLFRMMALQISISYDINEMFINGLRRIDDQLEDYELKSLIREASQIIKRVNFNLLACKV